jgi:uncharacterized protein (DUF1330 family)
MRPTRPLSGPVPGEWDLAQLIEYPSPDRLRELASDQRFREIEDRRQAAVAESRSIPYIHGQTLVIAAT